MAKHLDAKGASLADKARHAQAIVPRKVRGDLAQLVSLEGRAAQPKLAHQTDLAASQQAAARLARALRRIPPGKFKRRRRSALIARIAGQILTVLVLFLIVVAWRDLP